MKDLIAALQSLTLPWDAVSGMRIVLDGVNGRILFYNAADELVLSAAPGDSTDPSGNDVERGFTSYEAGGGDSRATVDSGTFSIVSGAGQVRTDIQQGLIQFTEDNYVSTLNQINMDAQLGINLRNSAQLRRAVWNAQDGYWYAGTGISGDTYEKEEWTNATLAANWVNLGEPIQYKLHVDGNVHLRGGAHYNPGVPPDNTTVFTLPAGYRPNANRLQPAAHWGAGGFSRMFIGTNGVVTINGAPTNEMALDGIVFSVLA